MSDKKPLVTLFFGILSMMAVFSFSENPSSSQTFQQVLIDVDRNIRIREWSVNSENWSGSATRWSIR